MAEGERNAVLNYNLLALQAMFDPRPIPDNLRRIMTADALDQSIMRVDTIIADTPEARRARSLWFSEAVKDYRGEPYERAMVYLFRGCLYLAAGDFDNARACFLSGALQDAVAEEDQHVSDFASFDVLAGICEMFRGRPGQAQTYFESARRINPHVPIPPPGTNCLVFAFIGTAPLKQATGPHNSLLRILPGGTHIAAVSVQWPGDGSAPAGRPPLHEYAGMIENVSFQATTRGGREVDTINRHKANFKSATQGAGALMTAAGAAIALNSDSTDAQIAGLAIAGAGLIAYGIGAAMTAEADTRTWTNLPNHVLMWAGQLPPGRQTLTLRFYGLDQQVLHTTPVTVDIPPDGSRPGVAMVRLAG